MQITEKELIDFVTESNSIERIFREPFLEEIDELSRFMSLDKITIDELKKFVSVYQPDAKLRDQYGLNVRIGSYYPPLGGPDIPIQLEVILKHANGNTLHPYWAHIEYEKLHPFTDGNGRSGRALWAWGQKDIDRGISGGFLLNFYYQTLQNVKFDYGELL